MYSSRRPLVLLAALSCASVLCATEPTSPTLTEQISQSVTKEVMTQLKSEMPGLVAQVKAAAQSPNQTTAPVVAETPVQPVAAPPQAPSAGTRIANTGADALELMLAKAKQYGGRIEDGLSQAVDYGMKEAPIMVAEWLKWRFWQNILPAVFGTLLHIACVIFYICLWRASKNWGGDNMALSRIFGVIFGGGVNAIILCNFTAPHIMTSLQIWIAPRIYLIEELSKLVK